jgi:hypothetical protein
MAGKAGLHIKLGSQVRDNEEGDKANGDEEGKRSHRSVESLR